MQNSYTLIKEKIIDSANQALLSLLSCKIEDIKENTCSWAYRNGGKSNGWGATFDALLALNTISSFISSHSKMDQSTNDLIDNCLRCGRTWIENMVINKQGWGLRDYPKPQVEATSWGLMALTTLDPSSSVISCTSNWLINVQNSDFAWSSYENHKSRVYATCTALLSLNMAGYTSSNVKIMNSLKWLNSIKNVDGGWGFVKGEPSNVPATSLAILINIAYQHEISSLPQSLNFILKSYRTSSNDWGNKVEFRSIADHKITTVHLSSPWAIRALIEAYKFYPNIINAELIKDAVKTILDNQLSDGTWRLSSEENEKFPFLIHDHVLALMSYIALLDRFAINNTLELSFEKKEIEYFNRQQKYFWTIVFLMVVIIGLLLLLLLQPEQLSYFRSGILWIIDLLNNNAILYTIIGGALTYLFNKLKIYFRNNLNRKE